MAIHHRHREQRDDEPGEPGVELLPDEPILATRTTTAFDNPGEREDIHDKPPMVQFGRRLATTCFGMWTHFSAKAAKSMNWIPRVEPYVGYGTDEFSRLICRTTYAPQGQSVRPVRAGIRQAFMVPAGHTRVRIGIDGVPVLTVQVGDSEVFDMRDKSRERDSAFTFSDSQGYLDLLIEGSLPPGMHDVAYTVENRRPVHSQLFTIPSDSPIGVISDVDDTIMVTDVPRLWNAVVNMLFRSPFHRRVVKGMPAFYQQLRVMLPDAPFFYLSTSPWNVESSIRHLIRSNGYPQGPLLLRDFDPRPKTFVPSGVQHKLEFAEQLMSDFPKMRFIMIGDDGQSDPKTYMRIVEQYPGRVAAIGIRQVAKNPQKHPIMTIGEVPVFHGKDGEALQHEMMPFVERLVADAQ